MTRRPGKGSPGRPNLTEKPMQTLIIPLHHHPHLEEQLGVPADHVIIDQETFITLWQLVQVIEDKTRRGIWSPSEFTREIATPLKEQ